MGTWKSHETRPNPYSSTPRKTRHRATEGVLVHAARDERTLDFAFGIYPRPHLISRSLTSKVNVLLAGMPGRPREP